MSVNVYVQFSFMLTLHFSMSSLELVLSCRFCFLILGSLFQEPFLFYFLEFGVGIIHPFWILLYYESFSAVLVLDK